MYETHFKIWLATGGAWFASWTLEDWNQMASIIALLCGALASLSIAWWHIFKRVNRNEP